VFQGLQNAAAAAATQDEKTGAKKIKYFTD
jgi:hypothetical protein